MKWRDDKRVNQSRLETNKKQLLLYVRQDLAGMIKVTWGQRDTNLHKSTVKEKESAQLQHIKARVQLNVWRGSFSTHSLNIHIICMSHKYSQHARQSTICDWQ